LAALQPPRKRVAPVEVQIAITARTLAFMIWK
jgi:hypothetical protein